MYTGTFGESVLMVNYMHQGYDTDSAAYASLVAVRTVNWQRAIWIPKRFTVTEEAQEAVTGAEAVIRQS